MSAPSSSSNAKSLEGLIAQLPKSDTLDKFATMDNNTDDGIIRKLTYVRVIRARLARMKAEAEEIMQRQVAEELCKFQEMVRAKVEEALQRECASPGDE